MTDELKLTLPPRPPAPHSAPKWVLALLAAAVCLGAANLGLSLWNSRAAGAGTGISASSLRDMALKLERQELRQAALDLWAEYLKLPGISAEERANILYRMGTILQDDGRFADALVSYYRSEATAKVKDLAPEISSRIQECLERSGAFASLQSELKDRTSTEDSGPQEGAAVVAEIGPRKVTLEELDRRIEKMIDLQLEQFASAMPPEERARQREALLKRMATPEARSAELRRFLMEEVLTRKAREDKLHQDPAVRDLLGMAERQILAQKEMGRELADKIRITESDLANYYKANLSQFVERAEGKPDRQRTFEEARPEVYAALRRTKESEVQQDLLKTLEQKYDVVIHAEALGKSQSQGPAAK